MAQTEDLSSFDLRFKRQTTSNSQQEVHISYNHTTFYFEFTIRYHPSHENNNQRQIITEESFEGRQGASVAAFTRNEPTIR